MIAAQVCEEIDCAEEATETMPDIGGERGALYLCARHHAHEGLLALKARPLYACGQMARIGDRVYTNGWTDSQSNVIAIEAHGHVRVRSNSIYSPEWGTVLPANLLRLLHRLGGSDNPPAAPTREEIAEAGGVSLDAVPVQAHQCGAECATCEPTPDVGLYEQLRRWNIDPNAPRTFLEAVERGHLRLADDRPRDADGPPRYVPRTEDEWAREPVRAFDRHHVDPATCRRCGATTWRRSGLCNGCDR